MSDRSRHRLLRISLRELLLLVSFVAIGCAALKFANELWWYVLSGIALLGFLFFAVMAAVDRGRRQAFAIGFIVCAGFYGLLITRVDRQSSNQLDPYEGRYVTTRLLRPLFELVAERSWHDVVTGKELPDYQPNLPPGYVPNYQDGDWSIGGYAAGRLQFGGGGFQGGGNPAGGFIPPVYAIVRPSRDEFMMIGHLLWGMLLGYLGGRAGTLLYRRRNDEGLMTKA